MYVSFSAHTYVLSLPLSVSLSFFPYLSLFLMSKSIDGLRNLPLDKHQRNTVTVDCGISELLTMIIIIVTLNLILFFLSSGIEYLD